MSFRRNMVIVLAHGLRSDAVGDSRAWPLPTPHMERLAQQGLRLAATSASPSDDGGMLSLLTGLHARQHGRFEPTAGYHTAGVGCVESIAKWLTASVVVKDVTSAEPAGCAYLAAMREKGMHALMQQQRLQRMRYGPFDPDRLLLEPDEDIDGFIAAQADRMLARMPGDKPWALVVMFSGPGNELAPPPLYDHAAEPAQLEAGFVPADFTELDALAELDYPRTMLQRLEPSRLGRIRADYLGRVSLIDYGIGRLMAGVDDRADRDRTWFLLASDRGQLLGEHGLIGHRSFLTAAVETPLIVTPPAPVIRSEDDDGLVSTVDVAGTVCELGGIDLPPASVARSVLSAVRGQPICTGTGGVCISEFGRRVMLETERHKVVFDTESGAAIGLYDLFADPDERRNLADTPQAANVLDPLRWRLGDAVLPLRSPLNDGV
jgi:arylsulfatase